MPNPPLTHHAVEDQLPEHEPPKPQPHLGPHHPREDRLTLIIMLALIPLGLLLLIGVLLFAPRR